MFRDKDECSLFSKENAKTLNAPVSYYGGGLWRCRDGQLRKGTPYSVYDVGPVDLYLRVPIPAGTNGAIRIFLAEQALGEKLLNSDRVATLADTNFPRKGHVWDDTLDLFGVGWHVQFQPDWVAAAQRFFDKTVFEFYTGGELPFYQCNMSVMARWEPFAVKGDCVLPESMQLRRIEMCRIELKLEVPAEADFYSLFVKLSCRRHRGVC